MLISPDWVRKDFRVIIHFGWSRKILYEVTHSHAVLRAKTFINKLTIATNPVYNDDLGTKIRAIRTHIVPVRVMYHRYITPDRTTPTSWPRGARALAQRWCWCWPYTSAAASARCIKRGTTLEGQCAREGYCARTALENIHNLQPFLGCERFVRFIFVGFYQKIVSPELNG